MQLLSHYLKAIVGALVAGASYLIGVISPTATLGDLGSLPAVVWLGLFIAVFGTGFSVAAVTNGPRPLSKTEKTIVARTAAALSDPSGGASKSPATAEFRKTYSPDGFDVDRNSFAIREPSPDAAGPGATPAKVEPQQFKPLEF